MKILNELNQIIPSIADNFCKSEKSIFLVHNQVFFTLSCLKHHLNYQFCILSCISGVDFLYSKYRFSVVYELLSLTFNSRIRIKTFVNEITPINSVTNVYQNAGWWEREIWDLYGVYFKNHKDLRRILTDYGFEGFPMRKDYPLSGFIELRYDQNKKRIIVETIELSQEFRFFSFESSW